MKKGNGKKHREWEAQQNEKEDKEKKKEERNERTNLPLHLWHGIASVSVCLAYLCIGEEKGEETRKEKEEMKRKKRIGEREF